MFSLHWSGANQQQGLDGRTRELDVAELILIQTHTISFSSFSLSLSLFFPLFYHMWIFPPTLPLTLPFSLSLSNSSCQLFYTDNPEVGSEEEEEEKEEWRQCELHEEVCSYFKWNGVPIIVSITHDNWELHRILTPLREMDSKTKSHNLRCSQQNNGASNVLNIAVIFGTLLASLLCCSGVCNIT